MMCRQHSILTLARAMSGVIMALALSSSLQAAVSVSSSLSATSLRVTDTLTLHVAARWEGGETLYRFATPHPAENSFLQLTAQTVGGSQRLENGAFVSEKNWRFSFVCIQPGTAQVVPPVITCTNTETGTTDSASAAPMQLVIDPAPPPPFNVLRLWPFAVGLGVLAAGAYAGVLIVRRRRQAALYRALHKTPEEQAAELLETLRPLKREDRCQQFFGDLEKIILGLWEARVGKRLAGKTPTEVAGLLRDAGVPEQDHALVQEVLTQCHHARFGGGRVPFEIMDKSWQTVFGWVKPPAGT